MTYDLVGQTFHRLRVDRLSAPRWTDGTSRYYDCTCSCGRIKLHVRSDSLLKGNTKSCGCLRSERNNAKSKLTEGQMAEIVAIWADPNRRCTCRQLARQYGIAHKTLEGRLRKERARQSQRIR